MKKRLISFLLALSMMLSLVPAGAFAAAVQNLTISQDTHRPEGPGGASSGWSYDEDTDTLTIEDGYVMADKANQPYPYIDCNVVNKGTIWGAAYTNTVTSENGSFQYGIYKFKPTGTFANGSKEFHAISSSDGTAFGLNSKLYNITEAYSVNEQSVTVNAPQGKVVFAIEGANSGWDINGLDTDTATFVMGNQNVTITFKTNTPVETEYEITHQHGDLPDFSVTVDGAEVTTAKANTTVTLSLDTAQLPEGTTFAGWSVTAGNDTVNVTNGTSANNASFTMPGEAVTVSYTVTTISDTGDTAISSGDDAGAGVAIVLGGAAIGGVAYLAGTQLYLESVLPKGAAIPVNRQQLAELLWTTAGKPQPQSSVLFTDISAEAIDSQKAARWCVEQGLMPADGTSFKPSRYTFRPQVIKAWNDLQAMQKAG